MPNDIDEQPHILILGIDDDGVFIDEIHHLDSCEVEVDTALPHEIPFAQRHTCRVQSIIDCNGIDDIDGWRELPPGEYEIKSYYIYHPGEFGGSYGAEHETGIVLSGPHPFVGATGVSGVPQAYCSICGNVHGVESST
jgi:hypothetical protein